MTAPDFAKSIRKSSVPGKDDLIALVRPAILAVPRAGKSKSICAGESRLGGEPDLPSDLEWPSWKGFPLPFIGQINLSEVPKVSKLLPDEGVLHFFYAADAIEGEELPSGLSLDEEGCGRVLFSVGSDLVPRETPYVLRERSELLEHPLVYASSGLEFRVVNTFPDPEHPLMLAYRDRYSRSVYDEAVDLIEAVLESEVPEGRMFSDNQILGYPTPEQTSVCRDASEAASEQDPLTWELLLQVDSQENGMEWGDTGKIYFMIRREDLLARRFDRTWLILQST